MVFLRDLKKGQVPKDAGESSRRQPGDLLERERDYARVIKLPPNFVEGAMGSSAKPVAREGTDGRAACRSAGSMPGLTTQRAAHMILAAHRFYPNVPDFRRAPEEKNKLNRELLRASQDGDFGAAKDALDRGADVEARDKFGCTPWMIASRYGNEEIADLLKSRGADVNATAVGCKVDAFDSLMIPIPATLQAPADQAYEVPEASEASDDSGIHRFGRVRRALGALKHEMTAYKPVIFAMGVFAGIITSTIADRIHEYRAAEAAIVEKAPATETHAQGGPKESGSQAILEFMKKRAMKGAEAPKRPEKVAPKRHAVPRDHGFDASEKALFRAAEDGDVPSVRAAFRGGVTEAALVKALGIARSHGQADAATLLSKGLERVRNAERSP